MTLFVFYPLFWVPLLVDHKSPRAYVAQVLRSTLIDFKAFWKHQYLHVSNVPYILASICYGFIFTFWEHQHFPCFKCITIVILLAYYPMHFGFNLFCLKFIFAFWEHQHLQIDNHLNSLFQIDNHFNSVGLLPHTFWVQLLLASFRKIIISIFYNTLAMLRITDEGLIPKTCVWFISFIQFDFKIVYPS